MNTKRDHWFLRILKFLSIIIVLAGALGTAFAFYDYVRQFTGETSGQRQRSHQEVGRDTLPKLKLRFFIGAGVGAGIGIIYMVRCLTKREDP